MDPELIKKRHRELSKQQAIYVANRVKGLPKRESAIMAGYKVDSSGKAPDQVETSPRVQKALAVVRGETAEAIGITKEEVAQGLLEAANMARVMADPQAMVRAYSELGKMLGFYAPEKKQVEHNVGAKTLEAMKNLSDTELLKLAKGRVVEGEVINERTEQSESIPEEASAEDEDLPEVRRDEDAV